MVAEAAAHIGLRAGVTKEIFAGVTLDFPVTFARSLPLYANLLGMAGITICGRVWLLDSVRKYPADALLVLIRHEAEHVRQQRERPFGFYPRYAIEFVRGLVRPSETKGRNRFDRAYRSISFERSAYAAGSRARRMIDREPR